MIPSEKCEEMIKSFEDCRLKAYLPTRNDVPTIGYGSTGPDIHLNMTWAQEQADKRFASDLRRFCAAVAQVIGEAPTNQHQFDAMVSLAYNIGMTAFAKSTLLRMHKSHNYPGAAGQFGLWTKQKGVVLKGLVRRRNSEMRMYQGLPV